MNNSKVSQFIWGFFNKEKQNLTKNEKELNELVKKEFGYDAQVQIQETSFERDSGWDIWFYMIAFIDENGKLHLDYWS